MAKWVFLCIHKVRPMHGLSLEAWGAAWGAISSFMGGKDNSQPKQNSSTFDLGDCRGHIRLCT